MKKLKDFYYKLTLNPHEIGYDNHFTLVSMLVAAVGSAIATIFNIILPLDPLLTIITTAGTVFFILLFIIGRKYLNFNILKWIMIVSIFAYLDILWLKNYGTRGPIIYVYIIFYVALLLFWSGKPLVFYTVLFSINTIGMFWLEFTHTEIFEDYVDDNTRLIDNYSGLLIYILIATFLVLHLKRMYIRERDKALLSDKLKSAFLANMSHEIRTPMNSILGFTQLLQREIPEEKRTKYVELIHKSGKYLVQLIEDIIDISKIEAGELVIHYQKVEVAALFDDVYVISKQYKSEMNKTGVEIKYQLVTPDLVLISDYTRLKQILINLLTNAIKFTDAGKVTFTGKKENDWVVFTVEDTGIGIKEDELDKIFERFRKLEYENGRIYPGTGIGLSITKQLVELMGGTLELHSIPGKGSVFTCSFPIRGNIRSK